MVVWVDVGHGISGVGVASGSAIGVGVGVGVGAGSTIGVGACSTIGGSRTIAGWGCCFCEAFKGHSWWVVL